MKLGIMQPYLFPYIGYFQMIKAVDKYVIYDDVNYIKGGWINRNNILVNKRKYLFTVVLEQSSPNKLINEIFIRDNFVKLTKTIRESYIKAPFFSQSFQLLEDIFSFQDKNLGQFTANSIISISHYLGIETEFILSSKLGKDNSLKNKDKVFQICEILGADTYINAIGGLELYTREDFTSHNIELKFLKTNSIIYHQFHNEFVPWLSIIDVMMFNSAEEINNMLDRYELI
jgi:hypothetical protein